MPRPTFLPLCMSNYVVESLGSTNNSPLAEMQGIARATARLHRMMQERAEQEQLLREMRRRDKEVREQRTREKMEREARDIVLASSWPQQQEAISGFDEKVGSFILMFLK